MENKRFYSIDIIKMVFACLVAGIHAQLLAEFPGPLGEVVNSAFGRMAVPFFACVSGYFFIRAEQRGKRVLAHQIASLLKYYLVFTLIYLIWETINGSFAGMSPLETAVTIIKRFVFYGTYYHLWFFPCMIYSLLAIRLAMRWRAMGVLTVLSFVTCLLAAITYGWNQVGRTVILGLSRLLEWFDFDYIRRFAGVTLPFAVLGAFILKTASWWTREGRERVLWTAWIGSLVLNVLEVEFVLRTGIAQGTTVTFTLIPAVYFTFLIALRYPLENRAAAGKFCRRTSVILYGLHPLILEGTEKALPGYFSETMLWVIAVGICMAVSLALGWLTKERGNGFKKGTVI